MLDKYPESLVLLQRASLYVRQAQSAAAGILSDDVDEIETASLKDVIPTSTVITDLQTMLQSSEERASRDWYIHTLQPSKDTEQVRDKTDEMDSAIKAMSLQAGAKKRKNGRAKPGPLFFDVAFNYLASVDTETALALANNAAHESTTAAVSDVLQAVKERVSTVLPHAAASADVDMQTSSEEPKEAPTPAPARGIWGLFGRKK
jgi:hypothetical protein